MFTHKWSLRRISLNPGEGKLTEILHRIEIESDTYIDGQRSEAVKQAKMYCLIHGINYNECSVIHDGFM